jgi:hypothetical protein
MAKKVAPLINGLVAYFYGLTLKPDSVERLSLAKPVYPAKNGSKVGSEGHDWRLWSLSAPKTISWGKI